MVTRRDICHGMFPSLSYIDRELRTMLHEARDRQKFVSDVQYLRDMQHKVDSEYQVTAESKNCLWGGTEFSGCVGVSSPRTCHSLTDREKSLVSF